MLGRCWGVVGTPFRNCLFLVASPDFHYDVSGLGFAPLLHHDVEVSLNSVQGTFLQVGVRIRFVREFEGGQVHG